MSGTAPDRTAEIQWNSAALLLCLFAALPHGQQVHG